jgi:hypothetical protein
MTTFLKFRAAPDFHELSVPADKINGIIQSNFTRTSASEPGYWLTTLFVGESTFELMDKYEDVVEKYIDWRNATRVKSHTSINLSEI